MAIGPLLFEVGEQGHRQGWQAHRGWRALERGGDAAPPTSARGPCGPAVGPRAVGRTPAPEKGACGPRAAGSAPEPERFGGAPPARERRESSPAPRENSRGELTAPRPMEGP